MQSILDEKWNAIVRKLAMVVQRVLQDSPRGLVTILG